MVFNIILNGSNIINPNNTMFAKSFIGGCLTIPENSEMCISQIVIPYSWFNITANYNNNVLSYYWNGYYPSVIWNGTMAGTTFTGTADSGSSGSFTSGQLVIGDNLPDGTTVSSTGTGTVTLSSTYSGTAPTVVTGIPTFTGYITMTTISGVSTPILTLSSTVTGTFALNAVLYSSNTSLASNVYVSSLYSGTLGTTGSTYILSSTQTVNVGSSGSPIKFGFIGTYNTITFPDGFYNVSDVNNYMQSYMISKKQYVYNSTLLQNKYFSNLYSNNTYYATQFVLPTIPTSTTKWNSANTDYSWTFPSGFPFSAKGYTSQVSVVANMTDYLGLTTGIYPSSYSSSDSNVLSNYSPNASYVNSIVVRCNLVNNNATAPTDVVDTFYPNTTFGSNIVYEPYYEKWVDVVSGTYNNIYIYLQDQDGNQIYARDSNVLISLLLKAPDVPYIQPIQTIVQSIQPLDFKD